MDPLFQMLLYRYISEFCLLNTTFSFLYYLTGKHFICEKQDKEFKWSNHMGTFKGLEATLIYLGDSYKKKYIASFYILCIIYINIEVAIS